MGTICLLILHFGWAKPVPINPNNFKNPKVGMSLTALAGPASNFILAFLSLFLEGIYNLTAATFAPSFVSNIILQFLATSAVINISLCLFNLIPIPPLDGQKIIGFLLPDSFDDFFNRYGMYFQVILMLLLLFTSLITTPLTNMVYTVYDHLGVAVNGIFHMFGF
jgi:Zn-dependent protease